MAAPRPKKTVVKKKPPVKKKPSFLRKDTPRPARDVKPGDLRSQTLANDNTPRPAKDLKAGDMRSQVLKSASSRGGTVAKGLIKKIPVIGAAVGFIVDASPAGEGSDRPTGPLMKGNNMKPTFPKGKGSAAQPKSKVSSTTGAGRPEYPSSNKSKKISGSDIRKAASGTYTASYDVKSKKSGTSKAASVSPASKGSSRPPTRYQRESLAMEQRRSSGKPKKSIFSLFRKG